MTTDRWERTKQILGEALQLAPEQRRAYLDSACGEDVELRYEVESLITSHEEAGSQFLGAAASEILEFTSSANAPHAPLNKVIGNYRLVEEIGRGGMGQVWLAEQTAPVRRQVAFKLIKAGMNDDDVLKRFTLERQSLAIMDHPSIAKVFDAGSTPDGQPYFVMEYVPGIPITEYCDQKHLRIEERLELFIKVCEAVQHAHQKAIIHRDLKPANILVQEVDGKPVPRIIDFGLAKATSPQMSGASTFTQVGGFVGTPGYMSPEQCDRTGVDVDTRTDVYSLGVVLYVLLTGCLPFQEKPGKEQPLDEMLRQVREEDPPRPSAKVSSDRETSPATAEARGTEPNQLVSLLRGDLDWITMKALEKDRSRRYGTASEFAGEVGRYLKHEPIMARPASVAYRLRKYARRHRFGIAVAAGLVILLAVFAVTQAVQVRRITRERDRADSERDRARRITNFMTQMFKVSDPSEARETALPFGKSWTRHPRTSNPAWPLTPKFRRR
jgi:non-specific serine/threonine protein kinase/serine/threonine-protein kinase